MAENMGEYDSCALSSGG